MGKNSNNIKSEQLGISISTAQHQLRKMIMFDLVQKANLDNCFRCGNKVAIENFSIEHKENWLHSEVPKELFFDLNNIAFSHILCNSIARRSVKGKKINPKHIKRGEKRSSSKLKEKDIPEIRKLILKGESLRKIANYYGVHHSTVGHIKTGKLWNHIK
jgi:hypothetical protein